MPMNRLIMSSSPQISYTMSVSMVLSSAVSDLSADGHKRKCSNILFSTGSDAFSQNIERSLSIFFLIALSYMYTPVATMCHVPNFAPR